jgi:hypothetical protein
VEWNPQSFPNIAVAKEADCRKATRPVYRSMQRRSRFVARQCPDSSADGPEYRHPRLGSRELGFLLIVIYSSSPQRVD